MVQGCGLECDGWWWALGEAAALRINLLLDGAWVPTKLPVPLPASAGQQRSR